MEDHNLVKNTLDQIPQVNSNAKRIVGLTKEGGKLSGVGIAYQEDTEHLKSIPDSSENNNLGNLPSVPPKTQG